MGLTYCINAFFNNFSLISLDKRNAHYDTIQLLIRKNDQELYDLIQEIYNLKLKIKSMKKQGIDLSDDYEIKLENISQTFKGKREQVKESKELMESIPRASYENDT